MLRSILGVILGYIVMAAVVFGGLSLLYLALGADRSYAAEGSWSVSGLWIVGWFAVGLIAAIVGGAVCRALAKNSGAVRVLAGIVLVLGLAMAIPVLFSEPPADPRPADTPMAEAFSKSQSPVWIAFANAIVGAIGVLIGGRAIPSGGPKASAAPGERTEI